MPFHIIRNDITKVEAEAIVNAANSSLQAGGGVCGAIFSAAGADTLQKACDRIGYCAIGDAVVTKGFKLHAKYIIHTVGPIYGQDPANEENQLYSCYKNSLTQAEKLKVKSIAFPLISSGIYGYPKTEAMKIATRAIKDFLENHEMQIFLVVYDKKAFQISKKLFADVESFIDERMIRPETRRGLHLDQSVLAAPSKDAAYASEEINSFGPGASLDETADAQFTGAKKITSQKSLEELMGMKQETFSQMLLRLIDEKGLTDVEVYKRANMDRKLFSKLRKKDYTPKKITVVALIIALKLDMDEARRLLQRAGFAFDHWSKFDIIIEYFIENEKYDIFEINETLFAFDQQLLGA